MEFNVDHLGRMRSQSFHLILETCSYSHWFFKTVLRHHFHMETFGGVARKENVWFLVADSIPIPS